MRPLLSVTLLTSLMISCLFDAVSLFFFEMVFGLLPIKIGSEFYCKLVLIAKDKEPRTKL